jgi:hypothetical protein
MEKEMILQIYTVHDSKAETFARPVFQNTVGEAVRAFSDECSNEHSMLNKHPEDFNLYKLGEYDQGTGLFSTIVPVHIASARDFQSTTTPTAPNE